MLKIYVRTRLKALFTVDRESEVCARLSNKWINCLRRDIAIYGFFLGFRPIHVLHKALLKKKKIHTDSTLILYSACWNEIISCKCTTLSTLEFRPTRDYNREISRWSP